MGLFEQFPYTNFHEMNLDWFLKTFKTLLKEWEEQKREFADLKDAWEALRQFVENYFENLDVQQEINNKLQQMADNGELLDILEPWLTDFATDYNDRLAALSARMDSFEQLPAGSTTGDAELIAGRVDNVGYTFATIGENIRASDAKSQSMAEALTEDATAGAVKRLYPVWELGFLNTSGPVAATDHIRTQDFIDVTGWQYIDIIPPANSSYRVYFYSASNEYVARTQETSTRTRVNLRGRVKMKIVLGTSPITTFSNTSYANDYVLIVKDVYAGPYDLYPTGDTTDRTNEIRNQLTYGGACYLAPGDYYISNFTISRQAVLRGAGRYTRLIKNDFTNPYAVILNPYAKIENLLIDCNSAPNPLDGDYQNGVDGIKIVGSGSDESQHFRTVIDNVEIMNCSGAGIHAINTGYGPWGGGHFTNLFVHNCNAGIWLDRFAEYYRLDTVSSNENYYGIVNGGGNNVMANCDFSGNIQAVDMDNTGDIYQNASHGTFTGCTFNHNGQTGLQGTAIKLVNMLSGEMFNSGQFFYADIDITDSHNMQFNGCNFGSAANINITRGGVITFNGCIFHSPAQNVITIVDNSAVHFNNCYYRNGTPVVA